VELLLSGRSVKAENAEGWLIDYAGSMEDSLKKVGKIITGGDHGLSKRGVRTNPVEVPKDVSGLPPAAGPANEAARKALMDCIQASCSVPLSQALEVQAKHSAGFMVTKLCQKGVIGGSAKKIMNI